MSEFDPAELSDLWLQFESFFEGSQDEANQVKKLIEAPEAIVLPEDFYAETAGGAGSQEVNNDLRMKVENMRVPEKIKIALCGSKPYRAILIADRNRMVQQFVLRNPKLGVEEIEEFAKNPNTSDHIIRSIVEQKEWIRNYAIKKAVVMNPKTPADISLRLLKFIHDKDLKLIARSKGVPQVISSLARKMVAKKQQGGGG